MNNRRTVLHAVAFVVGVAVGVLSCHRRPAPGGPLRVGDTVAVTYHAPGGAADAFRRLSGRVYRTGKEWVDPPKKGEGFVVTVGGPEDGADYYVSP